MYRTPGKQLRWLVESNDHSLCASMLCSLRWNCRCETGCYSPAFFHAVQNRVLDCFKQGDATDRVKTAQAFFECSNLMPCSHIFHALADVDWLHAVELFPRSMQTLVLGRGRRRQQFVRLMNKQVFFTRRQLLPCFDLQGLMDIADATPIHLHECVATLLDSSWIRYATNSPHDTLPALGFLVRYYAKVRALSHDLARRWKEHLRRMALAIKDESYGYPHYNEWAAKMLLGAGITI